MIPLFQINEIGGKSFHNSVSFSIYHEQRHLLRYGISHSISIHFIQFNLNYIHEVYRFYFSDAYFQRTNNICILYQFLPSYAIRNISSVLLRK